MRRVSNKGRQGFTLIELLVVVAIIALLISILLPSLARARELAKRTACAANMSGIGKGLHTYATEGNQGMPISAHAGATADLTTAVKYMGTIGSKRGSLGNPSQGEILMPPDNGVNVSTARNLWTLIRAGGSTPGSFVCPSSEDAKNDEDSPQDYWDFGVGSQTTERATPEQQSFYKQISYGYQVPYGRLGKPSAEGYQRAVLSADKGPWSNIQAENSAGNAVDQTIFAKLTTASSPDDWRQYNSPNHGGVGDGEGQNVLFADSHADWSNKPTAGPALDNIYTRWSLATGIGSGNAAADPRIKGTPVTAANQKYTPWSPTDGLIYP
jgi:prepilin-type N-terminal cleavage/methylation domain-containing protein